LSQKKECFFAIYTPVHQWLKLIRLKRGLLHRYKIYAGAYQQNRGKKMQLKWKLFTVIIVFWVFGAIGIIIQISQSTPPAGSTLFIEIVKIILLLLGGLGVVMPTYLNVWQSIENNKSIQERLQFDKVNNAFNLVEKWDDPALFAARKFSRELKEIRGSISDNELLKEIDENHELKQSVILIFNYFEQLRISVMHGRVDEKIAKESLRAVFIDIYNRFLPWVKTQSQEAQDCLDEFYQRWRYHQ
jgi:hypothetical protein